MSPAGVGSRRSEKWKLAKGSDLAAFRSLSVNFWQRSAKCPKPPVANGGFAVSGSCADFQLVSLTAGIFHEPSRMEGGVSFGQYSRIIKMNLSFGAGNQFCSFALPGDSF